MTQKVKHMLGIALAITLGFALIPSSGVAELQAQDLSQGEGFNKGGRTALQFLKIGVGARQAAMGEASIAWVHDVNSIYWNPAATAGIESMEASFSYTRWLADLDYVAGAIGARWRGVGTFTLAVASLDYGQIPEAVVGTGGGDGRTGNTFSGGDIMVAGGYSREFTDRLAIGVGVKWIRESLFDYSVSTVAYDVGSTYNLGWRGVRLSMAAQNFGGAVKWLGDASDRVEGYDLPLVFRIGMSTNLFGGADSFFDLGPDHRMVVAAEAINTNDYSERLNLGAEYWFSNFMALRGGYRFNNDTGRWTLGAGLHPTMGSLGLRIDYAYMSHEYLNAPHRFTVTMAF